MDRHQSREADVRRRRQRGSPPLEILSFQWTSAGGELALLRLEAIAGAEVDVSSPELVVTAPAVGAERLAALPRPDADPDVLKLAFPAAQAAVEDPGASFALELEPDVVVPLPRPEEIAHAAAAARCRRAGAGARAGA